MGTHVTLRSSYTHNMYKLVLSSILLAGPAVVVRALSCFTNNGKNFKVYCGPRSGGMVYADRCVLSESKPLKIEECENDEEYECFLQVKYPNLKSDQFVKRIYAVELSGSKELDNYKGYVREGVAAGCRK